jgi:hypothetical protein
MFVSSELFVVVGTAASALSPTDFVFAMSLVLVLDHGLRHLKDRMRDWQGHWYRVLGVAILALALMCYTAHFCGFA